MAILNYTTKISVDKTIMEIEKMLAQSGASKILKYYDINGDVETISFKIVTEKGELPFRLPMNGKAVLQSLKNQSEQFNKTKYGSKRLVPKSMVNKEQAGRVAWRIIKDWLEAQLALFFLQMVKMEEIFLPYMYNEVTGQNVFSMLESENFNFQLENESKPKVAYRKILQNQQEFEQWKKNINTCTY